ncbi:hypothetical protein BC830DRAFT_403880 [Chytriomyces sp. MP71]|nr:hypothetical protein BC830DRAFT_403880 [Chytriomyces sp. MP71]
MNDDTRMELYNIQDAFIGMKIAQKSKCIEEIIAITVITKSPVSDTTRFISGTLMTNLTSTHTLSRSAELPRTGKYKGTEVLTPVRGYHTNIDVHDFKSLYPNIMILANVSVETVCVADTADPVVQREYLISKQSHIKKSDGGSTTQLCTRLPLKSYQGQEGRGQQLQTQRVARLNRAGENYLKRRARGNAHQGSNIQLAALKGRDMQREGRGIERRRE